MANVYATKTGNWTDNTVWNTGAQPTSSDDVYTNGFTVTVNTSPTVLSMRNAAATGINAGGSFTLQLGTTINANFIQGTTATLCTFSGGSGSNVTINGNITGNSSTSTICFNNSSHALVITGNITAGGGICLAHNTTASLTITGTVTGGTSGNAYGVQYPQAAFTITGSVYGGSASTAYGVGAFSGNLTVNGNVYGGTAAVGIYHQNAVTVTVNGNAFAGTGNHGILNNTTGIVRVTNAVGNGFGLGSVGVSNVYAVVSNVSGSQSYVKQLTFGSLGQTPVSGPIILTGDTTNTVQFYKEGGGTKTLSDPTATSGLVPAATDVRTGVVYSSGNLTGTCAVPAAGNVALGVPVDATTGTAVLTAAAVRTAVGMASANLDTQLAPLTNLDATVSSRLASSSYSAAPSAATNASAVRTELTTELGRIDAMVSSRLATSGYTAPPSVGDIATAVWAAATRTLTTAIDNSATIAAAVWGYATGRTITGGTVDTLTNSPNVPSAATIASQVWSTTTRTITGGTVDTLTNAPSVPSAATIASQVRTELSTELARIDVATSTRLAPSGTLARVTLTDTTTTLTNAPDVPTEAEIAAQVRTELATELGRIDATVSSRLATSGYTTPPTAAAITSAVWAAADKTGYSLTSAERQAIATAVEQSILNESDGQQVLNAIVGAIGNTNVDQVALVAAIRADLERTGGTLATRLAASSYTAPPTAAANATAVRSELSPELARVANCATVATTGQQIQDAVTN